MTSRFHGSSIAFMLLASVAACANRADDLATSSAKDTPGDIVWCSPSTRACDTSTEHGALPAAGHLVGRTSEGCSVDVWMAPLSNDQGVACDASLTTMQDFANRDGAGGLDWVDFRVGVSVECDGEDSHSANFHQLDCRPSSAGPYAIARYSQGYFALKAQESVAGDEVDSYGDNFAVDGYPPVVSTMLGTVTIAGRPFRLGNLTFVP